MIVRTLVFLSLFCLLGVTNGDSSPTVVEGISVSESGDSLSSRSSDGSDDGSESLSDLLALESNKLQERDGVHSHHAHTDQIQVPSSSFDSFSAPPSEESEDSYGSPLSPVLQGSSGSFQRPIPVPLPVPVNAGSIVLPASPSFSGSSVSVSGPILGIDHQNGPVIGHNNGPQSNGQHHGHQNSPQIGPINGPYNGPINSPQIGPNNGPHHGPINGPHHGPINGPHHGPQNGPHQNGPQFGPQNGPHQNGPQFGPQNGPHQNGPQFGPQNSHHQNGHNQNGHNQNGHHQNGPVNAPHQNGPVHGPHSGSLNGPHFGPQGRPGNSGPPRKPSYSPKPNNNGKAPSYSPRPRPPLPQRPPPIIRPSYRPVSPSQVPYQPVVSGPLSTSHSSSSVSSSNHHIKVPSVSLSHQSSSSNEIENWPKAKPDMPKILSLDVTCEKNLMKVFIEFDKAFYGIIFSKGHYSDINCVHLPAGLGQRNTRFDVSINSCGTTGNTENGLYGHGADSGSGTYFENTIVIQYDPQVQEVWDQARKLRCTWHDEYEKSVTFRPFAVDMLDVVRADFAGDNVGCWMQIQVGKGPWASEVSGLVKIGQTMTMVLAIKDDEQKFDMMIRNCMAHDGRRAPIQLVNESGCVTRPKLMSQFTKIKNFGASASVLSYAHFQAFKFPDSMEVHFQCTIQICRYSCPDQCGTSLGPSRYRRSPSSNASFENDTTSSFSTSSSSPYESINLSDVGVEKVIQVVSSGDLTFAIQEETLGNGQESASVSDSPEFRSLFTEENSGYICMSTPAFAATLVLLLGILFISCLLSACLCLRSRSYLYGENSLIASFSNPVFSSQSLSSKKSSVY